MAKTVRTKAVAKRGGTVPAVRAEALPASQNPAAVYLSRLTGRSRDVQRGALEALARMLGTPGAEACQWAALRYQHTQALRARLAEGGLAPATANRMLAALRGTLREAWRLGLMSAEDYQRSTDLAGVRGSTLPRGRSLQHGELKALFAACGTDKTPAGARDTAVLAVLYGAGLRRAEAVALDVADYDRETGALTVRHGKGNKARVAYATNGSKRALDNWLDVRGTEPGALFVPVLKGGTVEVRRMSAHALWLVCGKRGHAAGIADFGPHDLRRTFVGDLLDAGADISTVQQLAGHASVTTTQRYDRRPEAAKKRAAELLHVPVAA